MNHSGIKSAYLIIKNAYLEGRDGRFYTKDALSGWTNLGKDLLFVWLCVSSIQTVTRRIMRLDELSFEIRLERRIRKVVRLDAKCVSCPFLY